MAEVRHDVMLSSTSRPEKFRDSLKPENDDSGDAIQPRIPKRPQTSAVQLVPASSKVHAYPSLLPRKACFSKHIARLSYNLQGYEKSWLLCQT